MDYQLTKLIDLNNRHAYFKIPISYEIHNRKYFTKQQIAKSFKLGFTEGSFYVSLNMQKTLIIQID